MEKTSRTEKESLISMSISFDGAGENTKQIFRPDIDFSKSINAAGLVYPGYKDKIVVFPILYLWKDDTSISVGQNSGFLSNDLSLWPKLKKKDEEKAVVF